MQDKSGLPDNLPLGRSTEYRSEYAPELLCPIPRSLKRREIGIDDACALPFVGEDLWTAYELSWLDLRGKPRVALGEFRVPASSPCLIESKSLKLYLNSFNQTRLPDLDTLVSLVRADMSSAAGSSVEVKVLPLENAQRTFGALPGVCVDGLDVDIDRYIPDSALLRNITGRDVEREWLHSHLLKSNCLVTGQPDWGAVAVCYSGPAIEPESLLRYIVSFRMHHEFHEQCVERIFMDILHCCQPRELAVWARYTRRGGLDINPFRASREGFSPIEAFEIRQ